jgi:hypothetical protein
MPLSDVSESYLSYARSLLFAYHKPNHPSKAEEVRTTTRAGKRGVAQQNSKTRQSDLGLRFAGSVVLKTIEDYNENNRT